MKKIFILLFLFSFSILAKSETADFTYSTPNGLFCNPSIIQFTETASGSPKGFVWTFGNGTGSNSASPLITYNKAGSYTVKLIVIYARTTAVVTKTIVISPTPTASIGFDRNYICKPGIINFTAGGLGSISEYEWDFGDGTGSQATATKAIAHSFSDFGEYAVTLKATSSAGCFDAASSSISVKTISITGTVSPTTGCIPANVAFSANATIPSKSTITNYSWNFGGGSPVVSTLVKNINHNYSNVGNYSPMVTITTSEGCSSNFNLNNVAFGTPPFNVKAYPMKDTLCGSDSAVFVSKATNANSYSWNFGDGTSATVKDTIVKHKFATLGTKTITVTPAFNGCKGPAETFQVTIEGVIAKYSYSNSCNDKKTFSFTNASQGNLSSILWDFGDSSSFVNTINAKHTFPSSGYFITKLSVYDSVTGCSDDYKIRIYTSDPLLVNPDSSICKNSNSVFSVINSYDNPSTTYTWNVIGKQEGPLKDSSLATKASVFGNFNNYVIIKNGSGYCSDTLQLDHKILVKGPILDFDAEPSLCLNDTLNVTNNSKPYLPQDSVLLWYWDFGTRQGNDTIYQPTPTLYPSAGTYKVKLSAIDINGCGDSLVKTVVVHPLPFLYVIPNIDTLCYGTTDSLFAFHSDSITWSPNTSLSCSRCDTVLANPSADIQYYATAASKYGCSTTDSIMIKAYAPFLATSTQYNLYICNKDTIQLKVSPPDKKILWTPAIDLSNGNNYDPIASPSQTTTYTATLTDSVGCFTSSTDITVHVKSRPTVDAGADQSYPYNSPFTINPTYSNNISSFTWIPGNLLSCNTCPSPSGVATSSNTFLIKVTSDSGCVAQDSITIFVECKDAYLLMPNAFTPNSDNLNDNFYPLTRGIKSITRFSIYDRMGNLVYEAKNFPPNDKTYGWNGRINGADQSTAVFVYYMEAVCDLGEKLYKRGSVVLIR